MPTILLLLEHQQNKQLLAQSLREDYHVLLTKDEANLAIAGEELLQSDFDLCFMDFAAVHCLRSSMLAKREIAIPTFLPFVFLTTLKDVGISSDHLEELIDDVIYLPIKKIELQTKIRVLLRSRSYSLQLQAAQAQLNKSLAHERELNQLKTRFVSTVSHEFRNPLNGISGMTQLLKAYGDKLSPSNKAEILAGLQRNVTKMTALLDDMLIISRTEMGKILFNPAPLDLEKFCRGLISEIQTVFNHKQSIQFVYFGTTEKLNLDSKLLHHILNNLLSNACKYSAKDTVIDFEVCCKQQEIIFTIRDQGIGIPPEDLPNLFDSFYRASNAESIQGTGLGLAIAKEYAELHQGAISVVSELEVGSTFTVTIALD
ncbi:MAG: ATP-binding protein [Cyanobacteria bacterium P01_A01_bin.83]